MIWHLLRCKEWIVITEDKTGINASPALISVAIYQLCCESTKEDIKILTRMDSALNEANNIIKGVL